MSAEAIKATVADYAETCQEIARTADAFQRACLCVRKGRLAGILEDARVDVNMVDGAIKAGFFGA